MRLYGDYLVLDIKELYDPCWRVFSKPFRTTAAFDGPDGLLGSRLGCGWHRGCHKQPGDLLLATREDNMKRIFTADHVIAINRDVSFRRELEGFDQTLADDGFYRLQALPPALGIVPVGT